MNDFLRNILLQSPVSNVEAMILELCHILQLNVTASTISRYLKQHPDSPSLSAVSDTLEQFNIESLGFHLEDKMNLKNTKGPIIVQIKEQNSDGRLFAIVLNWGNNYIRWWNPTYRKTEIISQSDFLRIFTGYGLALFVENAKDEKNYKAEHQKEILSLGFKYLIMVLFPIACVSNSILSQSSHCNWKICFILNLLYILGTVVCALLINIENSSNTSSILNRLCHIAKNANCSAVVNSSGSKLFGVSFAVLGFSYFLGILLWLNICLFDLNVVSLCSWIHLCTLPIVVYSIYYQYRFVHKWCPLCMGSQLLIVLVFLIYVGTHQFNQLFSINLAYSYLPSGVICIIISLTIGCLFEMCIKSQQKEMHLQNDIKNLTYNPAVFQALLSKEHWKQMPSNMGISLGNPERDIHITMVCNPYCMPCARAHEAIEKLLDENPNICLQIIFYTKEHKEKRLVVAHLLALYQKDPSQIAQLLDEWYLSEGMTYEQFSKLHPIQEEIIAMQDNMIHEMNEWCSREDIKYTPMIFVNGYKLPILYNASDLKFFYVD